jgi:hypothetical protein
MAPPKRLAALSSSPDPDPLLAFSKIRRDDLDSVRCSAV